MEMLFEKDVKPFLKWAGGKTQLIEDIKAVLPKEVKTEKFTYIEPFVGSGAILFWVLNNFPNVEKAVINDINSDLIGTYKTIKNDVENLISILQKWEIEYHSFENNEEAKKEYYYEKREKFNKRAVSQAEQAALFILLNRTCFNGLYRVNRNNEYNVPIGSYKKPQICNPDNLRLVSKALQKVIILNGDYSDTLEYADKNTLFYFDPPYKPLSGTSSFNNYAKDIFNDDEQIRLKEFSDTLNVLGHNWILSNSDVKGKNPDDDFFDDLYNSYFIKRVKAKRSINANPDKRGELNELLITNYQVTDYIEALKLNKEELFVDRFDKPYWTPVNKVEINNIKIDKSLMSFDNPIYESTLEDILYGFDLYQWIPITVNKDYYLLDGQHRLEAAKRMKLKYIDVVIQNTELLESNKSNKVYKSKKFIL